MGIQESASLIIQDALRQLARQLDAAAHRERGKLVDAFAVLHGWSRAKVYRRLKEIGWTSGRKTREDKGSSSQCDEALLHLCAVQRLGVRKNGKVTMQTPNARSLLAVNGRQFTVGNARLNSILKQRGMDINKQKQDRAVQPLRSLHPNHVHLVDPSLCLIYYLKDGTQHVMRDDEFYKNKPDNFDKIKLKVWRYVLVDHYSGTVIARYYESAGESSKNLYDFLLYCWKRLDDRPFHGVPGVLYWDKGSANTAGAVKQAMKSLSVKTFDHKRGNPRAKGSVEQANNLVEKLFESRLRYEPVQCVADLNAAVEGWYNAYNADAIPHYDSRLKRRYMREPKARYAIWQIIRQDQLRILPDEDVCRYLLSAEPVDRKVKADLTVSFKHPVSKQREWYDVSPIPNIYPNAVVRVSPLIYGNHQVMVYAVNYQGEEDMFVVEPLPRDEFAGFRMDGAIIGQEMKSQPDTVIEQQGKAADRAAFPGKTQDEIDKAKDKNAAPFDGTLDAHSHLKHVSKPDYIKRPGSELSLPDQYSFEAKPLTHIETCKRLVAELDRSLDPHEHSLVRELYPDGVPESEFSNLLQRITSPSQQSPTLKLVN